MKIHVWGTDFRRSSAETRKQLYFAQEDRKEKLKEVLNFGFQDLVYLETCNRVEFYTTAPDYFCDTRPLWFQTLASVGLSEEEYYRGYHFEGKAALRHLMRVSCSLESLVVGEPQILGQIKSAMQWSKENLLVLPSLERAFQQAFEVAKNVRTLTTLSEKPVSVASLGLNELQKTEADFPLKRFVVVGRSPISLLVLQWLIKNRPQIPITWVNRRVEKLKEYPEATKASLMPLSDFLGSPPPFSHLVTATSSVNPLFDRGFFEKVDRDKKIVFDFAQPPDIDKAAMELTQNFVRHVHLEGLKAQAKENAEARSAAVSEAEHLIQNSLKDYCLEQKEAPLLRDFNAIEPKFLDELSQFVQLIQTEFPPELQPKLIKMAEKLVKKNLHCSREHLRYLLRNVTNPDEHLPGI